MSESGEWSNQPVVTPLVIVAGGGISGVYVFDPKAVAGDLIASMTDSLTDPFGDVTVKGVAAYVTAGGRRYAVGLNTSGPGGLPGLTVQNTASPPTVPAGVYAESSASGTLAEAALYSGQATAGDVPAQVIVFGALESGITNGQAEIIAGQTRIGTNNTVVVNDNTGTADLQNNLGSAPAATGAGSALYSNTNGTFSAIDQTGWAGQVPVVQSDSGTGTNANGAGATALSAVYTIPANNLKVGTWFTIEMPYQATMEATNTLQLGLSIDGSTSFTTSDTLSAAIVGAGIGVRGVMRVMLQCTATGALTGKINTFTDGTTGQAGAAATFANRGALTGQATNVTLDTTVSHTIRINSLWGGSTAGQTVSGFGSRCTREGP